MSLYDGLDADDKSSKRNLELLGWGSSMKLMETQKQLQAKKASLLSMKQKKPATPVVAPVVDLRKKTDDSLPLHFNQQTGRLERMPLSAFIGGNEPVQAFAGVADEYDPLRPNEYEEYSRKLRQRKREEDKQREQEDRDSRRQSRRDDDEDEEESRAKRRRERERGRERDRERDESRRATGTAIAPPPSLLEEDRKEYKESGGPPTPNLANPAANVASKIMARMGYREGQGLGRMEQGMSTALQVEKTSKRGGKIIHERDIKKAEEQQKLDNSNANLLKNPSKVVVLRNMVGPGEVDGDLEGEVTEECTKYGTVVKCLIFEIADVEPEEAVRIFLEFDRMEAAIKAVVDLNGRFFGGRTVRACFYNLDKFRTLELGNTLDE